MKTRLFIGIAALIFLAVGPQQLEAEFYRYVDQRGNVLYTDDLSKVPPEQRDKAQAYEESKSPAVSTEKESDQKDVQKDAAGTEPAALAKEREQIEAKEKALNSEYSNLMKERSELDQEKQNALTPAQIKAYNQKIVDFNTRIQAYEEKCSLYADQVKSFNERAKEAQKESRNQ